MAAGGSVIAKRRPGLEERGGKALGPPLGREGKGRGLGSLDRDPGGEGRECRVCGRVEWKELSRVSAAEKEEGRQEGAKSKG